MSDTMRHLCGPFPSLENLKCFSMSMLIKLIILLKYFTNI